MNHDGTIGYYSVFYVRADSPYKSIEDLKGKNLGLVDPNSTSGNNVPRFLLNKQKIVPETFFSHVTYTGSHENAVLALSQKTVDVAADLSAFDFEIATNLPPQFRKRLLEDRRPDFCFRVV